MAMRSGGGTGERVRHPQAAAARLTGAGLSRSRSNVNPETALAGVELTPEERSALLEGEVQGAERDGRTRLPAVAAGALSNCSGSTRSRTYVERSAQRERLPRQSNDRRETGRLTAGMATQVDFEVDVSDVEYQQLDGAPWPPACTDHAAQVRSRRWWTSTAAPGTTATVTTTRLESGAGRARRADGGGSTSGSLRQAGEPCSVCDLISPSAGSRQGNRFGGTSKVGALGVSSGGHLVLLSGMRPRDSRYASLPLAGHADVDAQPGVRDRLLAGVGSAVSVWGRPARLGTRRIIKAHDAYWGTEAAMSEGSPPLDSRAWRSPSSSRRRW